MQKPLVYILLIGTPWIAEKWDEPLARHLLYYRLRDGDYIKSSISFLEWNLEKVKQLVREIKNSEVKRLHILYLDDPGNHEFASTIYLACGIQDTRLFAFFFDADMEGSTSATNGWMWRNVQPRHKKIPRKLWMSEPYELLIDRARKIARTLSRVTTIDQIWLYGSLARAHKASFGRARDLDFTLITPYAEKWIDEPGGREDGPYRVIDSYYLYVWVPEVTKRISSRMSQINYNDNIRIHPAISDQYVSPKYPKDVAGEPNWLFTNTQFNLIPPNPTNEWWQKFRELGFDFKFPESMVCDALLWDNRLQDFVQNEGFPGRELLEENLADYSFAGRNKPFEPTRHYLAWVRGKWQYKAYFNRVGELVPAWDRSLIGMQPSVYRT